MHVHLPSHGWRDLIGKVLSLKLLLVCACLALWVPGRAFSQPVALSLDPPIDRAHPASGKALQFVSHGKNINAMLYLPAGTGPHRAVILLHGMPGNEQNLDLARAVQRAGWAVVTFHYRGSWGSGGNFTLRGGCEDMDVLLNDLSSPSGMRKWDIDPRRIVVVGHSYGGFVATCAARHHPELLAIGLIAPWDVSYDAREYSKFSPQQARQRAPAIFNDVNGRLTGTDAASLMKTIRTDGARFGLAAAAPVLAHRPLLIATATRDGPDDQGTDLRDALARIPGTRVTYRLFDTDHSFNDQRIALETYVLNWLATLPVSPKVR